MRRALLLAYWIVIFSGLAVCAWPISVNGAGSVSNTTTFSANGNSVLIGSAVSYDVKRYGAKGDAAKYAFALNAGTISCTNTPPATYTGTVSNCSTFTPGKFAGATAFIPNAVETPMSASLGGGTTLNGAITSGSTSIALTPPSGTHWSSVLPSGAGEMLIDSELIAYTSVSTDTFTVTRAAEGTTAASHSNLAAVTLGGFDVVDAGSYTALRSYAEPFHEWDAGEKIVIPARGWTYASPGVLQGTDPAAITGTNETAWYAEVLPKATSTGTNQVGSVFTPLATTITTIAGGGGAGAAITLAVAVGSNISNQTEVGWVGHDDTSAIQSAINAASAAGGGTVVFPAGCYVVNGPITLASHVHVVARGAIFVQTGHALPAFVNFNGGSNGGVTPISGTGTLTADDPQMSTFSYNGSAIVSPVQFAAAGSCSESTTYYYKITGLDTTQKIETALSSTMNFGRPSGGNDTINISVLKTPYTAIKYFHLWRSDGLDANGNYQWKLWRTVNSNQNASPPANEWTVGYSNLIGFQDNCSTFTPDATKTPPTTNGFYSPLVDVEWDGGTFYGNNGCSIFLSFDYVKDLHVRNIQVYDAGDIGIKFRRVDEGSVEHSRFENCPHGILAENCQHIVFDSNKILSSSVAPALNYHDQAFAATSRAHSTGNPFDYAVTWVRNEVSGACRDYGSHCQGMQNYGAFRLTLDNNNIHDLYLDPNDTTYGMKGSIWSPAISHGLAQAIRFRDSSGQATNNRIENPHSTGILVDRILDFSDQIENGDDNNVYNDRPLVGGNVDLLGNTIKGALLYGIHVSTSSEQVPTAVISSVDTGTYSTCPVSGTTVLTAMDTYAAGHAFAPALISPCRINDNTILDTGVEARATTSNAIEYYTSGGTIDTNRMDGVGSTGIYLGFGTVSGTSTQTQGTTVAGNTVRNLGYGTANNINWKVGVYSMQQNATLTDNTVIAQDSGTLSGSYGIRIGYNSGSPFSTSNYSATVSGNRLVGVGTNYFYLANTGGGQTVNGDVAGNRRIVQNGGTALATTDFGTLTGWGTSPSVSAVTGTDSGGTVTITAGTGSPSANPTFVLTFKDGAWPVAPYVTANVDGSSTSLAAVATASTTTAATFTFVGTPSASGTYKITWQARQ